MEKGRDRRRERKWVYVTKKEKKERRKDKKGGRDKQKRA